MKLPFIRSRGKNTIIGTVPGLPVELWILILTEALRPALILDTSCVSSNMEFFHSTIADEEGGRYVSRKTEEAKATRASLRLVNKRFNSIVDIIPKKPGGLWARVATNEPSWYRPMGKWYSSVDGTQYERLDLKLDFEMTSQVKVLDPRSISTLRLFLRRKVTGREELAFIRFIVDVLPQPEGLRVLHLFLDFCVVRRPREMVETLATKLSLLTTLSLTFTVSNPTINIIYEPLTLLYLRTLFLKFHVFGATDNALKGWDFPSLTILSLDLRIRRHGVDPVQSVPTVISTFITRHGRELYGLRLLPGPWSVPSDAEDVQTMPEKELNHLCKLLPRLEALSSDFSCFPFKIKDSEVRALFGRIRHLGQIKDGRPSSFSEGLSNVIRLSDVLESVIIRQNSTELLIEERFWLDDDKIAFAGLRGLCSQRSVKLMDVLGSKM
jgi:hypothetical protein